jgi:hypothetical protein
MLVYLYVSLLQYVIMVTIYRIRISLERKASLMQIRTARPYHLRLMGVLLVICASITLPSTTRAVADPCTDDTNHTLCLDIVKKGDLTKEGTATYTIPVQSGKQIIVVAFDVGAIRSGQNANKTPSLAVDCPNYDKNYNPPSSAPQKRSPNNGQATRGEAVFCRPVSADGSDVAVTVTLTSESASPVIYGLVAMRLDRQTASSFDGLNVLGAPLSPRKATLFYLPNRHSTDTKIDLQFAPSTTYFAPAAVYRQDGTMRCGTYMRESNGQLEPCDVYSSDYPNYYLLLLNAGDTVFSYNVRFNTNAS